tara:strand:- start:1749 stop:2207 length:459 start_codon:yes stop_codon:yes gene_type:complete
MKLNELKDNPGAKKARTRVGRGEGSGKGKTCGSGQKGQKARTGVSLNGYEGGQNPLYQRLPKRGFSNVMFRKRYTELNLGQIQAAVDAKTFDPAKTVSRQSLIDAGLLKKNAKDLKLLGKGDLKTPLNFEVSKASKTALDAVEKLNGKIKIL